MEDKPVRLYSLLPSPSCLSLCVCPSPSWKGLEKYKQDALVPDHKSPLICSLASGPGPRPALTAPDPPPNSVSVSASV